MSSVKFPSQRHSYHEWVKKLHRKFPTTADALIGFLYPRMSVFDYGVLTLTNGVLAPRHANYKAVFNQAGGRFRKLTKSDAMCHLIGKHHSDKLWFTAEPFQTTPYGNTYVLVVLDFDNKTKTMPYAEFKSLVVSALQPFPQLASCWMNPSTNGNGVHLHVALEMVYQQKTDICDAILILQRTLKKLLAPVGFDLIAGSPPIFNEDGVDKSGKLALLPLLKNDKDAAAYLKMIKQPIALSLILQQAKEEEEKRTVTDCGTPALSPSHPQELEGAKGSVEEEEKRTVTDCGTPALLNANPNERMIWCCQQLARKLKRMPIPQELVKEYEDLNLNTGADNGRRRDRAISAIAYVSRTFNPNKTGPEFGQSAALNLVKNLNLTSEELSFEENKKLNLETVAKYLAYVTSLIRAKNDNPARQGTVSKVAVIKHLGINPAQYYRMKALAEDYRLIERVSNSYVVGGPKHGISKKYRLGENHPLR